MSLVFDEAMFCEPFLYPTSMALKNIFGMFWYGILLMVSLEIRALQSGPSVKNGNLLIHRKSTMKSLYRKERFVIFDRQKFN